MTNIKEILNELRPDPDMIVEILDANKANVYEKTTAFGTDEESFKAYCDMHIAQGTRRQIERCPGVLDLLAEASAEVIDASGPISIAVSADEETIQKVKKEASGKLMLSEDIAKGEIV